VWERLLTALAGDADRESAMIDSPLFARSRALRAHKKSAGQAAQAWGRSRGGVNSKVHSVVEALGNPLRVSLTG
jgi:hypothetical protein